jgi:flagellar assembly protein FliH
MSNLRDKMNQVSFNVEEFEFKTFSGVEHTDCFEARSFELKEFPQNPKKAERHQKIIRQERGNAEKNNFRVAPIVLEHRGLLDQERKERELQIQDDVERRVEAIRESAYEDGFKRGLAEGRNEVFNQTKQEVEEKLEAVSAMISEVIAQQQELLEAHRNEIYTMVRHLTKWVILRELSEDGKYLERLLEKLVHEINTKTNLLIKVDPLKFESMPDVLDVVQGKLGQFKNLRVEVESGLGEQGLIIESDNGIINATFSQQMAAIDKIFLGVGGESDGGESQS